MIYHISNNGKPTNSGSYFNPIPPSKIPDLTLESGDELSFNSSETFENITLTGVSGITINKYGDGDNVLFSSFAPIKNYNTSYSTMWEDLTRTYSGVWVSKVTGIQGKLKEVKINGIVEARARYPKTGYLTIQANSSSREVELTSLPNDFTGGQVVIRKELFITDTHEIVSQVGSTLTYANDGTSTYNVKLGYGCFIQNHISCLTEFGDWYFDEETDLLYVYFGDNEPIDDYVQVALKDNAIIFDNCSDITVNDIVIDGYNEEGIILQNDCSGFEFNRITVKNTGASCIYSDDTDASDVLIKNATISDSMLSGIYFGYLCHNIKIQDTTIKNCGLIEGGSEQKGNSDSKGCGIVLQWGDKNEVARCTVENIGFNGVTCNGSGAKVFYNTISDFCIKKSDGGGIYMYIGVEPYVIADALKILKNVVLRAYGNIEGAADGNGNPLTETVAHNIYMDDNMNNVLIKDNLMAYGRDAGIYLHNIQDITVDSNDIVGNQRQALLVKNNGGTFTTPTFNANNMVVQEPGQVFLFASELSDYGTWTENTYKYVGDQERFEAYVGGTVPYNYGIGFDGWVALSSDNGTVTAVNPYNPTLVANRGSVATSFTVSAGRGDGYLAIGDVVEGQVIRLRNSVTGDVEGFSFMLESDFLANGGNDAYKFASTGSNDTILPVSITRTNEQIIFLREEGSSGASITSIVVDTVTVNDVDKDMILLGDYSYIVDTN